MTTLDEATKKRVEPVLTAEYMSCDETAMERSDGSEHPTDLATKKKVKLPRRSQELQEWLIP